MTKSQLDSIFEQFPWIWGIKQSWHHEKDLIEINPADAKRFDVEYGDNPPRIWLFGSGVRAAEDQRWIKPDLYSLVEAKSFRSSLRSLGEIVLHWATTYFAQGLMHVAISSPLEDEGALHVRIFRLPKTHLFWDFLQRYDTSAVHKEVL